MQTNFTPEQLKDKSVLRSNEVLRACVHCGFCTATCPTYQVLGDELDSPRGRIYLIKDMLENDRTPDAATVKHIDRCLSCLACMSTCLAAVLPFPKRFRLAMLGAKIARPFKRLVPDARLRAMLEMAPKKIPAVSLNDDAQVFPAIGERRKRVALMTGCAQKALNTDINDATIRLLTRHGVEVVVAKGAGCCGALTHHMGKTQESHGFAAKNITAWASEIDGEGLDAIVINTSGCGTTVKDYGHMFRETELASDAARISLIAKDISEVLVDLKLDTTDAPIPLRVAYHSACSLQHGQQIKTHPKTLLKQAGFEVLEPRDPHLCCGSAGTYNLMQPEISGQLKARKIKTLSDLSPQVIAAGNIGCMMQIGSGMDVPVVHTVELLDWASGGPIPPAMTDQGRLQEGFKMPSDALMAAE